jgi:hypothetical protein
MSKTQICTNVKYAFLNEVDTINATNVVLNTGCSFKVLDINNALFKQQSADSDMGTIITQTLTGNGETDKETIGKLSNIPLVFLLRFSDETTASWGTLDNPVQLLNSILQGNYVDLEFYRKSTSYI